MNEHDPIRDYPDLPNRSKTIYYGAATLVTALLVLLTSGVLSALFLLGVVVFATSAGFFAAFAILEHFDSIDEEL